MCDQKLCDSLNTFAFDLFRIISNGGNKNEFISPFSILTALNMCLLGSKHNTEKELFEGLRYNVSFKASDQVHTFMQKFLSDWSSNKQPVTLNIANRVLVHKSEMFHVNAEYTKQLETLYKALVNEVDFVKDKAQILQTCNQWVNEVTKGKIPSILDSLDPQTKAVLINAIYFKGNWQKAFDESLTKMEPFYNFGDKTKAKNVALMYQEKVDTPLLSTNINGEELQMIELPYKGNVSMSILMTKSLDGLQKVLSHLNCDVIDKMKFVARKVNLWLPRFKSETNYGLVEPLKKLGIHDAFTPKADFSGIRNERDIYISQVIHKAAIEVNEEGTVASAATAITMVTYCAMVSFDEPANFRVDRPFVYFLRDMNTGVILFVGNVFEL